MLFTYIETALLEDYSCNTTLGLNKMKNYDNWLN